MEERARVRKERRDQLKQKYEEKRHKELLEKQAEDKRKEEEAQKRLLDEREARKLAKLEEAKAKEQAKKEAEEFRQRLLAADKYYAEQLTIKYGIIPFAQLIAIGRYKERQAIIRNREAIQKTWFNHFVRTMRQIINEKQKVERIELARSDKYR